MVSKQKKVISSCLFCTSMLYPCKSLADFDYKQYNLERKHVKSLNTTPSNIVVKHTKKDSTSKKIVMKVLEALDNEIIPVELFTENDGLSFYVKISKISKLGIKYKF